MQRILYLAQAEVLHIVRDRMTLLQILVVPLVQLLVLAHAATFVIPRTPVHIIDYDRSATSRGLVSKMVASGYFQVESASLSMDDANDELVDGTVALVVVFPHDFETSLVRTGVAPLQLIVDGGKGSAALLVQSYASRIVTEYSSGLGRELRPHLVRTEDSRNRFEVRSRGWFNPQLNYHHYMVPGILVALVTIIGTLLSAQNIAREKELGTLEQLNVTPISRTEFIAAKMLPLWVLGLVDLGIGLVAGWLVFDVPMRGSLLLLFAAASIYLLSALSIGLLVSTIVQTQQQAMFVTFFILNIYLLLSGLFTPVDSMARWVRIASQVNPVRHFVEIARAVLLKGAHLTDIAEPMAMLAAIAVGTFIVATVTYRKRSA